MTDSTILWQQWFSSYKKSLACLSKFVEKESLNEFEALGSIHAFEVTLDLAGNLLLGYARSQGIENICSPADATLVAANLGLICESSLWLEMLRTRNQEHEFYRTEVVEKVAADIRERFFDSMLLLKRDMQRVQNAS